MRIGLTGAGGTGKGTLGSLIANYLEVPFIPSHIKDTGIAMGLEKSYKDVNEEARHLAFQWTIMMGQIYQERALQIAKLDYVAERTTLDYIPYFLGRNLDDPKYLHAAREWAARTYDLIIYLPVEFEAKDVVENAWKERDIVEQMRTAEIIIKELSAMPEIDVLVARGSIEERFELVKSEIDKLREAEVVV